MNKILVQKTANGIPGQFSTNKRCHKMMVKTRNKLLQAITQTAIIQQRSTSCKMSCVKVVLFMFTIIFPFNTYLTKERNIFFYASLISADIYIRNRIEIYKSENNDNV